MFLLVPAFNFKCPRHHSARRARRLTRHFGNILVVGKSFSLSDVCTYCIANELIEGEWEKNNAGMMKETVARREEAPQIEKMKLLGGIGISIILRLAWQRIFHLAVTHRLKGVATTRTIQSWTRSRDKGIQITIEWTFPMFCLDRKRIGYGQ